MSNNILKIILSFCFNPGPPSIADIINYNNVCLDKSKRLARAIGGQGFFQNQQHEAVPEEPPAKRIKGPVANSNKI
jgi:hypothetical protein